jgi:Lipocalin-like domain
MKEPYHKRSLSITAAIVSVGLIAVSEGRAAGVDDLVGSWRLLSWQVVAQDGSTQDVFGPHPNGYLVLTREGRSIVVTTAEGRKGGTDDVARAALHRSMLAYSGRYRVEDGDFITRVEVSWNESWNGTEQRRHFRVEGDMLFVETAPAPSITSPGRTDFRRIVFERDR